MRTFVIRQSDKKDADLKLWKKLEIDLELDHDYETLFEWQGKENSVGYYRARKFPTPDHESSPILGVILLGEHRYGTRFAESGLAQIVSLTDLLLMTGDLVMVSGFNRELTFE